jgi:DNA repair photolyase
MTKIWKGRGSGGNPPNRFDRIHLEREEDYDDSEDAAPETQFFDDASGSIIARNDSPDIGFEASINPYRGCEHGCTYCYARPFHEFLGFSSGLDFETRIFVKRNAAALLRAELSRPSYRPSALQLSGVTDPYQPVERRLRITRACLEVLSDCRHPVNVITKNDLVCRDIDLLRELAAHSAVSVVFSIPTLKADLAGKLEPRCSVPLRRMRAMSRLREAGIAVGISLSPVIPALTDEEAPAILAMAKESGATFAFFVPLRLPHAVAGLFKEWLERYYPDRRDKILNRVRSMRGGALNQAEFGARMRGEGEYAAQFRAMFHVLCTRYSLATEAPVLSAAAFRRPGLAGQERLF